ncbi:hypothetical protein EJ05DRAFT_526434 [Pseudovirgaria hyperparasitica]|uniref:BTB domain-containing protein n=1 Tax=Pseudovirgaria hyperparasitica TaxID=470096 RepID=A0A6A6WCB8_9PEZI|nr:uncharacterized protein EJ05DRAFT_526434 [Pseudovirgaria hyperparasitica]KAF2759694.1 hypothetical protein EJ05DRAFT_526434 [Pseudovirgaria hyperparasitica]
MDPEFQRGTRFRYLTRGGTVGLIHGREKTECSVHLYLLAQVSTTFDQQFNGSYREVALNKLVFDTNEWQSATVENFVDWLYDRPGTLQQIDTDSLEAKLELYIFATHFEIPKLRFDALYFLYRTINQRYIIPEYSTIKVAYDRLPKDSPVRKLFADSFHLFFRPAHDNTERLAAELSRAPPEFFMDAALSDANRAGGSIFGLPGLCRYHDHKPDAEKAVLTACMASQRAITKLVTQQFIDNGSEENDDHGNVSGEGQNGNRAPVWGFPSASTEPRSDVGGDDNDGSWLEPTAPGLRVRNTPHDPMYGTSGEPVL